LPLGQLTPRVLLANGFGRGDGSTHVYVERAGGGEAATPAAVHDARAVSWLPLP